MQEGIGTTIESRDGVKAKLPIAFWEWKNVSDLASTEGWELNIEKQSIKFIGSKDGLCELIRGWEEKIVDWAIKSEWGFEWDGITKKQSD